jgi:putative ABC transport system permease protein
MFRNFLKTAARGLYFNKSHSFINIAGLAVGMAVAMLIGLWIWDELSFNTYHEKYSRIVQVRQREKHLGATRVWDHLPYQLISELKTNYKEEFQHVVPTIATDSYVLSAGEKKLKATGLFIDESGPEVLTLRMFSGSRSGLDHPNSVLLAASVAKAFFGDANPVGKLLLLPNEWDPGGTLTVTVTGVYDDLPQNSSFTGVQFLLPWQLYVAHNPFVVTSAWDDHRFNVYAELRPGLKFADINSRIGDAELNIIKHLSQMKDEVAARPTLFLNPMGRWHLYSDFKDGVVDRGPVEFVWLVGIIGAFVLLLACINFMNLSTARASKRAKEVGIRKAVGSLRSQLIGQFYSESLMVVLLAFAVALLLVGVALPSFNDLAAKQLSIPWRNGWFWMLGVAFIVLTGLMAGSYPALYLSSFRAVSVLKGAFKAGRLAAVPRKALVVLQFGISVFLIICTIAVYQQVLFAKNRPVGYDRNGLLMIPVESLDVANKIEMLQREIQATGAVTDVAESESAVTEVSSNNGGFTWKGKPAGLEENFGTLTVSTGYGKTIGWEFLAGRDFSTLYNTDSACFVINESAARFMGLQHPVGETIRWKSKWLGFDKNFTVIGVIKDMLMQSPYEAVKPTIFRLGGNTNWIYARISPNISATSALSKIESVFRAIVPETPFDYKFADDEFARKFATEVRIGKLAGLFAVLAVFISCMGLFGMASWVAEQRVREIGIRKILGASVVGLWGLLSREFVALVALALVVVIPVAYMAMHWWLGQYQYRTALAWWIFAAAGAGALLLTLLTVSWQTVRAARANPVDSLKIE